MGRAVRPNSKCCVCGKKRSTHPGVKLHLFPKDTTRRMQWLRTLNIAYEKDIQAICTDHFDSKFHGCKGRLLSNAVPRPLAPVDSTVESTSKTALDLVHSEIRDGSMASKFRNQNKATGRNTHPKFGVLPLDYKKFDDTNFGKISFSNTPELQVPESPIQTPNLMEDVLLNADHSRDWNASNSNVNLPSNVGRQEAYVPQSSIQSSSIKDNTLLHKDLGKASGLELRKRKVSKEQRKGIIIPQLRGCSAGTRMNIDVPDISPSAELLPISYKCDTPNYGKITFSNTNHQDVPSPESSIRGSSLDEDTLHQINLDRDVSMAVDVVEHEVDAPHLPIDVPEEEIHAPQSPSQMESMEDDIMQDTVDLGEESSPTSDGEESQVIDAPEPCGKRLTESSTSTEEPQVIDAPKPCGKHLTESSTSTEEPQVIDVPESCGKHVTESSKPGEEPQVIDASKPHRKRPAPEDPDPLPQVIECSSKATNFPEVPRNVRNPSSWRKRYCRGCWATLGAKSIQNPPVKPKPSVGVQVKLIPETSEWSTQTDLMTADCGVQTSITADDLRPYGNRHLKYEEVMHRKCTTDYIMKDDTTCMFFTGLTVACLMYLHKYLKDKPFNIKFFEGSLRSQHYWTNQIRRLTTLEAFLLCLTHLRRGIEPANLACMFRVHVGHISMFTITWISFLHKELSFLNRRPAEGQEEDEPSSSGCVTKKKLMKEYRLFLQPKQFHNEDFKKKALSVCEALWNLQP